MRLRYLVILLFVLCSAINVGAQSSRYAEKSVLSRGDWFKIQVSETGVHKITYEQLVQMGVSNPANVSVFGYGGAQLSESFANPYIDDLPQNAIYMEKGSDGVFGKGDYILFYAQGPIKWEYSTTQKRFIHEVNSYSNYGYYFLTSDADSVKYIKKADKQTVSSDKIITSFDDYYLYEKDEINLINSGRVYLGDRFDISQLAREFVVKIPNLEKATAQIKVDAAHISVSTANMQIAVDNEILGNPELSARPANDVAATKISSKYSFTPKKDNEIRVRLTYSNSTSTAYLDFFEINVKRKLLKVNGEPLYFRFIDNLGSNENVAYKLSNVSMYGHVWNVSDPQNVVELPIELSGKNKEDTFFVDNAAVLKEYVAFHVEVDKFLEPKFLGRIDNQDLHGLGQADMVIIAPTDFVGAAKRLADIHMQYDGLTTHIVTPDVVYNEFSSGTPDATAYRRFMKMFYDRAKEVGNAPQYLLLFGDGSFDNRQILKANTDKDIYRLLTYQAKESFDEVDSYTTDDYFGLLDDTDGSYIANNSMDIAIGRIPAYSVEQANGVVDKLIKYIKNEDLGDWKNISIFMADDGDGNLHVVECDSVCNVFERNNPSVLTRKLYLDSYIQEVTAVGEFYPALKKEFYDYINSGVLMINYMGHSGYNNWTNEQILTVADIDAMYNTRLPLFITASCSFSRFDDFKLSGGEAMMLNAKGGALALITTTRTVYAHPNMLLNLELVKEILKINTTTNRINTIGEAYRLAKNKRARSNNSNRLSFILLGDPAIRLTFPEDSYVAIDSINGNDVTLTPDTVGALGKVTLSGSVRFKQDSVVDETFNGLVGITIFDKEEQIETLLNDATPSDTIKPFVYTYRTNPFYMGRTEVVDGRFSVEFIVPKDIRYNYGAGRIIMYAIDEERRVEASGNSLQMIIGGDSEDAELEYDGPKVKLYLNTPYFENGDKVNENPVFFAELSDVSGINTIGSGIGHDIILRIDDDPKQEYVLNNYYRSNVGSYTSGVVSYQLSNLPTGKHKLFFRVWDLQNNSTSAELNFEVISDLDVSVSNINVYPNPISDYANVVIEHDRPMSPIDMHLYLYDLAGRIVWQDVISIVTDASCSIHYNFKINSSISEGLYFMKAIINDGHRKNLSKTTKILVRKQ